MSKNIEPLYIPVKLQQVKRELAERIHNRNLSKVILNPQKKGLFAMLMLFLKKG
jgi:hypothetical protein